jgi:hypothetical protein
LRASAGLEAGRVDDPEQNDDGENPQRVRAHRLSFPRVVAWGRSATGVAMDRPLATRRTAGKCISAHPVDFEQLTRGCVRMTHKRSVGTGMTRLGLASSRIPVPWEV